MNDIDLGILILGGLMLFAALYFGSNYISPKSSGNHREESRLLDLHVNSHHTAPKAKQLAKDSLERINLYRTIYVEKQMLRLLAMEDFDFDRIYIVLEMQHGRQVADHYLYLLTHKNVHAALEYASKMGVRLPHSEELDRMMLTGGAGEKIIDTQVKRLNSATEIEHEKQHYEVKLQANAKLKEMEDERYKKFLGDDDERQ